MNKVLTAGSTGHFNSFIAQEFKLINSLPVIFYVFEEDKHLVRWNKELERSTGYSRDELLGMNPLDFFEGQDLDKARIAITRVIEGGGESIEANLKNKDHSKTPYFFSATVLIRNYKNYLIGTGLDITDLKSTDKELYLTKYSIDNSSIAVYWIKRDGHIYFANKTASAITGFSHEELIGMEIWRIGPNFSPETFESQWLRAEKNLNITFESIQRNKDGYEFPVEVHTSFQEFEGEEYIFAYIQDISERKKSEEERSRLVSVIEQSHDSIMITDLKGNIEYVNPALEKSTGYSRTELFNQNPRILKSEKHDDAFHKDIWQTITSGHVWRGTIINKCKDGKLIHESATIFPVINSKGETANLAAVKRDITGQIRLEEQLRQTQKLEAIGTLAGGIAHDFNNILGAIYAFTNLAQKKLPDSPDCKIIHEYLSKVKAAGARAENLVKQILTFSRKVEYEPKTIDFRLLLKESLGFLEASLPSKISVKHHIDPDLDKIFGDYTQAQQIIMNLCTNAFHAMDAKGGTLEIILKNFQLKCHSPETVNLNPGKYVVLIVKDTGTGMDEHIKKRIFEPFYTSKENGKGTGLGLSVVHGIVEEHGGQIIVYSKPGLGTKVSVYLPISKEDTYEEQTEAKYDLPTGSESILLVDDEIDIADAYKAILEIQGYQVKSMTNSREALMEFTKNKAKYDLVITDYTMPWMDGFELSKLLQVQKENLPIILISGLGELITNEKMESKGIRKILPKPVETDDLIRTVRYVLDDQDDG